MPLPQNLPPGIRARRFLEALAACAIGVAGGVYIFDKPLREYHEKRLSAASQAEKPPTSA